MTNANYADRLRHNKLAVKRTVKVGFESVFPNANIAGMIQRAVSLATPIIQQAHLLANLHVLRMCETGQPIPRLDSTFWNRCSSAVSVAAGDSVDYNPTSDPQLTISLAMYNANVPASFVKPRRPPLIKTVMSEANVTSETHTANHVATNFFSHTKRLISLQLTTSPHPQPHAQSYFSSLTQRQVRAWSSLLLRVGTNPQHSIAGLLPTYTTLPLPPAAALAHAQALVTQMHQTVPNLPATSDRIRASPHMYLPWMWHILQYMEPLAAAHVRGSKLFTMVPQCGNQTQFITITSTCLHRLLYLSPLPPNTIPNLSAHGVHGTRAFIAAQDTWWSVHTRCKRFADRHRRGWQFGYVVSTDGVSVSIGFERSLTPGAPHPAQPQQPGQPQPQPQPVRGVLGPHLPNLHLAPRIVGLDPGRINIYTAVVHTLQAAQTLQQPNCIRYETLQCTAASFRDQSGAKARCTKVARWMKGDRAVSQVMKHMPSARTSSTQVFSQHISYRLQHSCVISTHFTSRRYKTLRWSTYIKKQRAVSRLCNEITANNRQTVVAFGNASFAHNSKGNPSSLTKTLKQQLASRCRLYEVDEHNTSAKYCACYQPMTGMHLGTDPHNRGRRDHGPRSYHVRLCTNTVCHRTLWHRDVNASITMLRLFLIWAAGQARPQQFT